MSVVPFAPRPSTGEVGAPGTKHWGGYITTEEYVPELTGKRALDTFERMRRSDGSTRALLRALKLPILSAPSEVDPASEDLADIEIATFVRWNLFEGLSHSWRSHVRQALGALDFGYSVFELVWGEPRADVFVPSAPLKAGDLYALREEYKRLQAILDAPLFEAERAAAAAAQARLLARYDQNGTRFTRPMAWLRKVAPRLQRTISQWHLARDGGLVKITQSLYGTGESGTVDIDVDKLVVYVHDQEGANWTGLSELRATYKHWFLKDQIYRFQAINAERFGVGIPVVTVGPDDSADDAKMKRAEEIGEGVRSHEKGNVALPHDWKFAIAGIEGRTAELDPVISHHDREIFKAALAQFVTLGDKPEGSNALSGDQSSFFLMVERAIADDFCDAVNRYVIPKLVDANWSGVTRYPKLVIRKIETRDIEKFWNALANAVAQGLITADDPLEAAMRVQGGLPPRDQTTARKRRSARPPRPQTEGQRPGTEPPPAPEPAGGAPDEGEDA